MRLGFIAPVQHLQEIDGRSDLHFALGHIARESESYRAYFRQLSLAGEHVMLDNGVWELGSPMPVEEYLDIVRDILPLEVYGPDHLYNPDKTLEDTIRFAMKLRQAKLYSNGVPIRVVGVVQGRTLDEWLGCYEAWVKSKWVDTIAIPVLLLDDFCEDVDSKWRWGMTRLRLMQSVLKHYGDFEKPIHLTGIDYPFELGAEVYKHPNVRSNDSKGPIVAARYKIRYDPNGVHWPGKMKSTDYFAWNLTETEVKLSIYNMRIMRSYLE